MNGKELKKWRVGRGLTRKDASKALGFDPMHIYKMETGRAKVSPWIVLIMLGEVKPNERKR
jgi:transcriptional regulator with XRE-family HTH domain